MLYPNSLAQALDRVKPYSRGYKYDTMLYRSIEEVSAYLKTFIWAFLPSCHSNTDCHLLIFNDFQTLNSISAEKNSTIIFPLPMEILGGFMEEGVRKRKTNVE